MVTINKTKGLYIKGYIGIPRYTKMSITTIKVYQKTKIRLEKFKEYKKESYDDILKKLLYVITLIRENPELGKKLLNEIEATKKRMEERQRHEKQESKIVLKH